MPRVGSPKAPARLVVVAVAVACVAATVLLLRVARSSPDRGFDWGNFADGTLYGEGVVDRSQNWDARHVRILRGGGPNGGNAALLVANDDVVLPQLDLGGHRYVRIHGFRPTASDPHTRWFGRASSHEIAQGISIRLPPGHAYTGALVTTLELHGDNGTGPAPLNLDYIAGKRFEIVVRGSESTSTSGAYAFEQNVFGEDRLRTTSGGPFYRRERPFDGGTVKAAIGRWVNFRFWWHDLSSDSSRGKFTAWVNTDGSRGWRQIVDADGIRTAYPDVNGDGQAVYPMLSLYYEAGSGGEQAVEYAAGRIEPTLSRLARWQDERLGLA